MGSRSSKLEWLAALLVLLAGPQPLARAEAAHEVAAVTATEVRELVEGHAGKVVVVNFWASWCPPCLREFPDFVRLFDDYRAQGLEILAVSLNEADEIADVRAFLAEQQPPFSAFIAATVDKDFFSGIVTPWFGEIPITLVYDRAGRLAHYHRKPVTYAELASEVDALLR